MTTPRRGDGHEADQEGHVVAVIVADLQPELMYRVPLWHRELDRQQGDRDGDDGIGKQGQPVGGTLFVSLLAIGL